MSSSIGLNELGFKLPTGKNINDLFGKFPDNDDFMNLYKYKEYTFLGFEIWPELMYDKNTYTYINENQEYSILDLKYDFEDQQLGNTAFLDSFSKPILDKIISIINKQIIDGYEIKRFEIGFIFTKKKAELTLAFVGDHYGPAGKYFLGKKAAKEDSFVINSITKKELEKIGYDFSMLSTVNDKKLNGNAFLYSAYIFYLIGNGEEYEYIYFKSKILNSKLNGGGEGSYNEDGDMKSLEESKGIDGIYDLSNLYLIESSKDIRKLEVVSLDELDRHFKLIKNASDARAFNYHSDYWGEAGDYQKQNIELIKALRSYIGKKVCIDYGDGKMQGTLLGIAIDKQYSSIEHTKIVFDNIAWDEA